MARNKAPKQRTIGVPVLNKFGSQYSYSGYDLEGSPDEIIELMERLKTDFPGKSLQLNWEQDRFDDSYSFNLYEVRKETPEEAALRVEKEKEQQRHHEARERAEYERLAKKFS